MLADTLSDEDVPTPLTGSCDTSGSGGSRGHGVVNGCTEEEKSEACFRSPHPCCHPFTEDIATFNGVSTVFLGAIGLFGNVFSTVSLTCNILKTSGQHCWTMITN